LHKARDTWHAPGSNPYAPAQTVSPVHLSVLRSSGGAIPLAGARPGPTIRERPRAPTPKRGDVSLTVGPPERESEERMASLGGKRKEHLLEWTHGPSRQHALLNSLISSCLLALGELFSVFVSPIPKRSSHQHRSQDTIEIGFQFTYEIITRGSCTLHVLL
jgi:hypothetical protein